MSKRLQLHEFFFGGFLFVMSLWLLAVRGPAEPFAWLFVGQFAVAIALIAWSSHAPESIVRWRCRLLFYALAMNLSYFGLRYAIPAVHPRSFDPELARADVALLGAPVGILLRPLARPWLTDILSFCYFLFYPWLLWGWARFGFRDVAVLRRLCAGTFTIYGIGLLGYALVPAGGPHFFPELAATLGPELEGGFMTQLQARIVADGCIRVDAFPSLHCACSAFLLWFEWHHARRWFWVMLAPCVGLWFSTMYLRYHYLVDVLAGFELAAATIVTVRLWEKSNRTS